MNSVDVLVSICIPAYNAERFIAETLKSALAQDYPHTEIMVSDDASTDATVKIVQQYASQGVRLLRQGKTLGMHANWNAVIRASAGKYAVKLDADDLLAPDYVSSLVAVMEAHPRVTFAHCACRLMDVDGNFIGYERSIHGSFLRPGLKEWPRYVFGSRAVNIVMLRRAAYDAVGGYDERFSYSGDWKMHRDLLRLGEVFYHDGLLASYRVHAVGKNNLALLGAKEGLLHLADMEENWPPAVPGKARLLRRARRCLARSLVLAAARVPPAEAQEVMNYLPQYGEFAEVRLLRHMLTPGGRVILGLYQRLALQLRQVVKRFLYRNPVPISSVTSASGAGEAGGSRGWRP